MQTPHDTGITHSMGKEWNQQLSQKNSWGFRAHMHVLTCTHAHTHTHKTQFHLFLLSCLY